MGTRADFYIGRDSKMQWIGSCAFDGYPPGLPDIMVARTEVEFKTAVMDRLTGPNRKDGTLPEQGWPWPWKTSATTDYAYTWDGEVFLSCFGSAWESFSSWKTRRDQEDELDKLEPVAFPDMSSIRRLAAGTSRDSIMILQLRSDQP